MLVLAYTVLAMLTRALPLSNLVALIIVVSVPFLPALVLLLALILTWRRRKWLATASTIVLTATLALQVPWYYISHPMDAREHLDLRVLSSNLLYGRAAPAALVAMARDSADLIVMSELTSEAVDGFVKAGIQKDFPYSELRPREGASGLGVWSKFPLIHAPTPKFDNSFLSARVRVPGLSHDPLIASVHLPSPIAGGDTFEDWRRLITAAKSEFAAYAEAAGPAAVIIAGDFNSTVDMRQFRDLLDVGYQEAVRQTGAGFGPTYSPHPRIPPLITIDHVLTRNSTATSIHTVDVPGSDHRALLATVAVPLDPTDNT